MTKGKQRVRRRKHLTAFPNPERPGSVIALRALKNAGKAENPTAAKKKIIEVMDCVSKQLGNTRSVTKKYYVHPVLISLYENNKLEKYFEPSNNIEGLNEEENVLMKILEKN